MSAMYQQLNDIRDAVEGILGLLQEFGPPKREQSPEVFEAELVGDGPLEEVMKEYREGIAANKTVAIAMRKALGEMDVIRQRVQHMLDFTHTLGGTLNQTGTWLDELGKAITSLDKKLKQVRHIALETREEGRSMRTRIGTLIGAIRQREKFDG